MNELMIKLEKAFDDALVDSASRNKKSPQEFKDLIKKVIKGAKASVLAQCENANKAQLTQTVNKFTAEFIFNSAYAAAKKKLG